MMNILCMRRKGAIRSAASRATFRPALEALAGITPASLSAPARRPSCVPRLEQLEVRIVPSTLHHWTDATGDGKASTAGNWSNGAIAAGDSLVFDGVSGPQSNDAVSFDANFTAAVSSMTMAATYTGTLNVNGNVNIPTASLSDFSAQAPVNLAANAILSLNQYFLNGCTVNGPGALNVVNGQQAGYISVANGVTLSGVGLLTPTMSQFSIQGDVTFSNNSAVVIDGATSWTGGTINLQTNSSITNVGAWVTTCDQKIIGQAGTSFFNCGSFSKNNTTGQTNLQVAFSNAPVQGQPSNPLVAANSGTIEFATDANQAGQFSTSTAGTLLFDGGTQTFTANSQFNGSGSVKLNNSGQFVANTAVTVTISTAAFELGGIANMGGPTNLQQGPGVYTISAAFTWDGGFIGNATVSAYNTLNITGNPVSLGMTYAHLIAYRQTTYDATQDVLMVGSTIDNLGTFQLKNAQTIADQGNFQPPPGTPADPPSVFNNDDDNGIVGTVTKLAGGASTFTVAFDNFGALDFNGLAMTFAPAAPQAVPLTQSGSGGITDLGGGTMTLIGGPFNLNGGRLTGTAGATINGNVVNGALLDFNNVIGTLTINGNYTQTASGNLQVLVGMGTDLLNISGQASLGGNLQVQGMIGGPFHILHAAGGVLNTFADVTSAWEAVYLTNDVEVQTAGG